GCEEEYKDDIRKGLAEGREAGHGEDLRKSVEGGFNGQIFDRHARDPQGRDDGNRRDDGRRRHGSLRRRQERQEPQGKVVRRARRDWSVALLSRARESSIPAAPPVVRARGSARYRRSESR